jgi:phosphohistidine phosphatase
MKTLLLLRHAKSARNSPGQGDHDRPLNPRGERAAQMIASHIVRTPPWPDLILCSTALRTRQTLAPLMKRLHPPPSFALEDGLYLATREELRTRLTAVTDDVGTVLLIGHNEGIGELARDVARDGARGATGGSPPAALARLQQKFPTGTLAILRLHTPSWRTLGPGCAELVAFVRPCDITN